jgi:hypothetical protein
LTHKSNFVDTVRAVTGLALIIICVVVSNAVIGYQGRIANDSTISRPMMVSKDVIVGYATVDDDQRFARNESVKHRLSDDDGVRLRLTMLYRLETLLDASLWEYSSTRNPVISVSSLIGKLYRLAPIEYPYHYVSFDVLSWSLARIYQQGWNRKRLSDSEGNVLVSAQRKSNPGPFIDLKLMDGGIRLNTGVVRVNASYEDEKHGTTSLDVGSPMTWLFAALLWIGSIACTISAFAVFVSFDRWRQGIFCVLVMASPL